MLGEVWTTESGVDLTISKMGVDSGYETQTVYSWVRKQGLRTVAFKGSDTLSVMVGAGKPVDIKQGRKKIRRALKMFMVGSSVLKQELYGWLKLEVPDEGEDDPYGYCRFPEYDEEHFKRLTSETRETKWVKGHKRYEWVANGRNEQLDCRVYARAAANLYGLDRFKPTKWDELEAEVQIDSKRQDDKKVQESKKKRPNIVIKRRKTTFMRD
jgi:phage terminase large subunit GpA-like protein